MPHQAFAGRIPSDRLYCRETDMWVFEQNGEVLLGASAFGLHLAGEVIAFTSKPDHAEILRGKGMATIECHKTVIAVHAPISFRLICGNAAAEERPGLIGTDPYAAGWMARGSPTDWAREGALLCRAEEYIRHIQTIDPEARIAP